MVLGKSGVPVNGTGELLDGLLFPSLQTQLQCLSPHHYRLILKALQQFSSSHVAPSTASEGLLDILKAVSHLHRGPHSEAAPSAIVTAVLVLQSVTHFAKLPVQFCAYGEEVCTGRMMLKG